MRRRSATVSASVFVLALFGPAWAAAQEVQIEAPPPATRGREPIVIPPGDHGDATRPSDADYYPTPPKVRHEPAFIGPLSSKREGTTSSGRSGVAGWTSPGSPVGPSQSTRESSGWFAFGFAFEWGGPPAEKKAAPSSR